MHRSDEETRNEYQGKMEKELQDWGAKIDELVKKADNAKDNVKQEIQGKIAQLRSKQQDASQKLQELKSDSGQAWNDIKNGFEGAWSEFKEGIGSALAKFK